MSNAFVQTVNPRYNIVSSNSIKSNRVQFKMWSINDVIDQKEDVNDFVTTFLVVTSVTKGGLKFIQSYVTSFQDNP